MELPTYRPDYSRYVEDTETGELVQVHDAKGAEIPDPVPMAPPLGYTKPLSMFDQMRAQIRAEHTRLRQLELEELAETPDQANDFDIDEDLENQPSLYEEKFDPVDIELRTRLRNAEHRASVVAAMDKLSPQQKELLNGDALRTDERRSPNAGDGNRDTNPVVKGKSKQKSDAADKGSISDADSGAGEAEV